MAMSLLRFQTAQNFQATAAVHHCTVMIYPVAVECTFSLVIASAYCFIKSAESEKGAEGVDCGGPPQHNGCRTVASFVRGTIGVKKCDAL